MPYRGEWSRGQTTTLDGSGNGTLTFEPDNASQTVTVTDMVVSTSQLPGTTPVPSVVVYKNGTQLGATEGGTRDGDFDIGHGRIVMGPADIINVVFTGGPAGVHAYARLAGTFVTSGGP